MSIFPTKVLLATDGSEQADLALKTAADIAENTDSELHVVVVEELPYAYDAPAVKSPASGLFVGAHERARKRLDRELEKVRSAGGGDRVAEAHLRVGTAAREIVDLAEETGAGLIVMGSRGLGGMRRALTGSVSDSVVRHAHCPVMVVRGEPVSFPTKILLATDGSEDANLASSTATDLAKSTNSELHLLYVGGMLSVFKESPGAIVLDPDLEKRMEEAAEEAFGTRLEEQVQKISEAGGELTQTHTRVGYADREIVCLAEELGAGLIVMGSRGRGGLRRALMGSVSDSVVRHAHCPVMIVRPEKELQPNTKSTY
jgi:nucleotide-binding universal stress UspA family protein